MIRKLPKQRSLKYSIRQQYSKGTKASILIPLFLLIFISSWAQTFSTKGKKLYDYFGYYYRQEIIVEVSGLPAKADSSFGLESACITIHHNRISDLKITLEAPDGSSIWLTNRNGRDSGKNYINTCFSQFGKDGFIHTGTPPYTGEYKPDGQMEFLNHNNDLNGTWKIYVEDLMEGIDGVVDSVSVIFGKRPAHMIVKKRCNINDPGLCECSNGKKNCKLLPDLVIVPAFTENQVEEYEFDDKNYPGQLRFAATIANIGYGPMEVVGTKEWICGNKIVDSGTICADGKEVRQLVKQRIYSKRGNQLVSKLVNAGSMYFDNHAGHNHYHVDNWVEFRLVKIEKGKRLLVCKGNKVSYCLFTTGICYEKDGICNFNGKTYDQTMPNYGLGNYPSCNFDKQGISVGGYDTYGLMYEGQYLQLPKGLKNGEYILEIEIDPDHKYIESDRSNNTFKMKINIQKQQQ
jgi:hypothetical protein